MLYCTALGLFERLEQGFKLIEILQVELDGFRRNRLKHIGGLSPELLNLLTVQFHLALKRIVVALCALLGDKSLNIGFHKTFKVGVVRPQGYRSSMIVRMLVASSMLAIDKLGDNDCFSAQ